MRGEFTLIEELCINSVNCFGIWIPIEGLSKFVINFAEPLVLYNKDCQHFEVSRRGPATKVNFRGKYVLIATAHQLETYDSQAVVIVNSTTKEIVTSNAAVISKGDIIFDKPN